MSERRTTYGSTLLTLALLALNVIAFNVLISYGTGPRLDLTEDRLYSISPATERLLANLDEDLTILGYFSDRTHPKLAPLVPQVADMLDEYREMSNGRVRVIITDPRDNEEQEQEANNRYGVTSTPFRLASKYETGIVNAYFALVVIYGDQYVRYGFDDLIEIQPTPDGDVDVALRNLEYDLTRAIKKVVYGFRSTAELFERVDQPVKLTTIVSSETVPEVFRPTVDAVRLAADELEQTGGERFEYEEIDPTGDPALEAQVYQRFGARPMTLGLFSDEQFYLYGFLESDGRVEQVVLTEDGLSAATVREAIEDSMRRQTPGFLKTVGVVAPDPSLPPEVLMQLQMQGQRVPQPPPEFEQVQAVLRADYQIESVDLTGSVPTDVDVLVVLKPKAFDENEVFHLDQYLMRGGRVILCAARYEPQFSPSSGLTVTPVDTGLEDWLAHFGVRIPQTLVLDDQNQPLPIPEVTRTPLGMMQSWRMEPYPYLVEVSGDGLVNREIAARLDGVGIYWGSPLELEQGAADGIETIEILKSSPRSWTDSDLSRVSYVDYEVPQEGTERHLLAVALSGKFTSYFKENEPPAVEPPPGPDGDEAPGEPAARVVLEESPDTRLVVVGDAAFVSDLVARALALDSGFFRSNLAFVQNLIDWVNLDSEMLAIRSRGAGVARLERIERGTEVTIELANYLVPVGALALFGVYRYWRRRHVVPVVPGGARRTASKPRRAEG
ncbi:MAG TPA: Gldg family protein [Candidatus Polarisedimenticolaceae bacterium]|nr:Gldg family protein [Candidatus Polarisedimenticolaceae bacterium]